MWQGRHIFLKWACTDSPVIQFRSKSLCGHNAKIQAGIEYQTMDTPIGDFDTLTYLIAFRTFF